MAISTMKAAKIACQAANWKISLMQLQKVLYVAHMMYAGRHNSYLIGDDEFQAWEAGPVIPLLNHRLLVIGSSPISEGNFFAISDTPSDLPEYKAIKEAVDNLIGLQPYGLFLFTNSARGAWRKTRDLGINNAVIDQEDIYSEYVNRFRPKYIA